MEKSVEVLKNGLLKICIGCVYLSLLMGILVDYYGVLILFN